MHSVAAGYNGRNPLGSLAYSAAEKGGHCVRVS